MVLIQNGSLKSKPAMGYFNDADENRREEGKGCDDVIFVIPV